MTKSWRIKTLAQPQRDKNVMRLSTTTLCRWQTVWFFRLLPFCVKKLGEKHWPEPLAILISEAHDDPRSRVCETSPLILWQSHFLTWCTGVGLPNQTKNISSPIFYPRQEIQANTKIEYSTRGGQLNWSSVKHPRNRCLSLKFRKRNFISCHSEDCSILRRWDANPGKEHLDLNRQEFLKFLVGKISRHLRICSILSFVKYILFNREVCDYAQHFTSTQNGIVRIICQTKKGKLPTIFPNLSKNYKLGLSGQAIWGTRRFLVIQIFEARPPAERYLHASAHSSMLHVTVPQPFFHCFAHYRGVQLAASLFSVCITCRPPFVRLKDWPRSAHERW